MQANRHHAVNIARRNGLLVVTALATVLGVGPAWGDPPVVTNNEVVALQQAVADLTATFGSRYPRGREFQAQLAALVKQAPPPRAAFDKLCREALIANPLVSEQPLLYVVRDQYLYEHHNTETAFQTGECTAGLYRPGGPLKAIDFARNGESRVVVEPGPQGSLRDPDVYFDGKKVVFSMRKNSSDDYHVYEVNADGTGLKKLTAAAGVFDIDPFYLPDDSIIFTSSREPKYCMCNTHMMANLFKMGGDGANIHQIGKNILFEGNGSLMPDGRVLYTRWDYVDRNFGNAQGLWTVNPDGTNHAIYYGNSTPCGGVVLDSQVIPGTELVIGILSSCHDRPWGAMAILDRRRGVDGRAPVVRTWPADAVNRVRDPGAPDAGSWPQGKGFDTFMHVNPKYEDPYPLSDKYFLCSRMTGQGMQMGIYLLDVFGNEIQLHVEGPGCYDPQPLGSRPRPPVLAPRRDFNNGDGSMYVQNVYVGTHMNGVKPGSVKALRVVEVQEKRYWTRTAWSGQGGQLPGMNWHDFLNKRILGTVPVESDGSAYFNLSSDRFVFFQLLDKDGMMVQSMRSGTMVQSGEHAGCVGCHEDRLGAPPSRDNRATLAIKRAPSRLEGWRGPQRVFNYLTEVQPVFDRKCVSCHDYGKPAGAILNLAGDRGLIFNVSYAELWTKGELKVAGGGPPEILQPYSWGSHASRLTQILTGRIPTSIYATVNVHEKVKLTPEELDRIVTWVDINATYYPSYASSYPNNKFGRSALDDGQLGRLRQLGLKTVDTASWMDNWADLDKRKQIAVGTEIVDISLDRPEISPGLKRLPQGDPRYKEALDILCAGQAALKKNPNPDANGFVACELDQQRELKYQARAEIERRNQEAIRDGRKLYDTDVQKSAKESTGNAENTSKSSLNSKG